MGGLNSVINYLTGISSTALITAGGLVLVFLFLWLVLLSFWVAKSRLLIRRVFGSTTGDDLKDILQEHISRVGVVQIKLNDLESAVKKMQKDSLKHVQKIGVVRFNPFQDTGGDQSFVIALLDAENNGVVISSLHGRERTRIYTKVVAGGKPSGYEFSQEEKEAIDKAQKAKADG